MPVKSSAARTDISAGESNLGSADISEDFRVHNDATANWLIRQILERRAYGRRCSEWCEQEQARAKHEEEFFLFRYGQQLSDYAQSKIAAAGGRRKSVNLPAGTVGFRSESSKLVIDDEAVVVAWAKTNLPQAVVVTARLSKSDLNQHFEKTGELPGVGAHVEPAREKFYIK
jgi:hypothetical protein